MQQPALTSSLIRDRARPLTGSLAEEDVLFAALNDRSVALIGEASHGTRDFYRERIELTKRLIEEQGYTFVAVEADWPDAYRVHRFVNNKSTDSEPSEALADFRRFPAWMWRNVEVAKFIAWLRDYNAQYPERRVGFYGLDLYSLYSSIEAVIQYLEQLDPELAVAARARYSCFDYFDREPQTYGLMVNYAGLESCEDQVIAQLLDTQRVAAQRLSTAAEDDDNAFFAVQNARLVRNAEGYYRSMYRSNAASWNARDRHMTETLEALFAHRRRFEEPRGIVWAHNSHLGDARATEMSRRGELNVGQLVREHFGEAAYSIGFTTYSGLVTAARDWGAPAEQRQVRRALTGSFEDLFHETEIGRFLLLGRDLPADTRLERAIGVIYRPETERQSHYFGAVIARQFDAVVHLDHTAALEPLDVSDLWLQEEEPEPPVLAEEAVRA